MSLYTISSPALLQQPRAFSPLFPISGPVQCAIRNERKAACQCNYTFPFPRNLSARAPPSFLLPPNLGAHVELRLFDCLTTQMMRNTFLGSGRLLRWSNRSPPAEHEVYSLRHEVFAILRELLSPPKYRHNVRLPISSTLKGN